MTEVCVIGTAINPVSISSPWSRCPKKLRKCLICGETYVPRGSRQKVCLGKQCEKIIRSLYWEKGYSKRELANILGFSPVTIDQWFRKLKIKSRSTIEGRSISKIKEKWTNENGTWRPKRSSALAYVLGVMKGDGNVYKNKIQFRTVDRPFAERFAQVLKEIGIHVWPFNVERRSLKDEKLQDVWCVFASSMLFVRWYKGLDIKGLKDEILNSSVKDFLCGFYESEGTIYDNHGYLRIGIFNIDKELLNMVYDFICELDFTPTFGLNRRKLRIWKNEKICYQITLCKKQEVPKFINLINPCIKQVPRGR